MLLTPRQVSIQVAAICRNRIGREPSLNTYVIEVPTNRCCNFQASNRSTLVSGRLNDSATAA